jgi:SAM-dependent methyltransferase
MTSLVEPAPDHWSRHAPQWNLVAPPLKPSDADIRVFEAAANSMSGPGTAGMILGVTPELTNMHWPDSTRMVAVDRSAAMIRHHWTQGNGEKRQAVCANWCALPMNVASFDFALGDGSLNALEGTRALRAFAHELGRVLRPDGKLLLRLFTRPDEAEPLGSIFADLRAGKVGSFHAFKWRLAMSLHGSLDAGVCLADIWDCWQTNVSEPETLLRGLGWDPRLTKTIDVYRDVRTCYTFPTREEVAWIFAGSFREISRCILDYELSDRCPIVKLERLATG